ncbi:MAG: MnhB domain-containing protein [Methanomicrobiaceae archaeon]|nr:MnhB domain-containing protein [Methanomicrobiaceae archaeon]
MNMSKIVRSAANLLFPFILVFGFYIVLHGHLTPGGGFQGGAVIATGFVLMFVAYSYDFITGCIGAESLHTTETIGLLLFIVTALVALGFGVTFFTNWMLDVGPVLNNPVAYGPNPGDLNTAGFIPVMNLAVGIEVLGALSVIVLYMLSGTKEEI